MRTKVLVVGLDAATWDVMNPLLDRGALPNIAQLMEQGTSLRLRSYLHYSSPALWTTISTGKLPESHGVVDFYHSTRNHLKTKTLQDIVGGDEGRVGLFRWYATSPSPKNAGFTVPEYTARTHETYPAELSFINDLARPSSLKSYLRGGLGYIRRGARGSTLIQAAKEIAYEIIARPEYKEWWYRRQLIEPAIYSDIFTYLMKQHEPEYAAILFSIIDALGHNYWKYREPELFDDVSADNVEKYGDVIDRAYVACDKALGHILRSVSDETLVIALSDHGQEAGSPTERPYLVSQSLLGVLGLRDDVWLTHLGQLTVLRPKAKSDQRKMLERLERLLASMKLKDTGEPIFDFSSDNGTHLEVRVRHGRETLLQRSVILPDDGAAKLGDLVFARDTISGDHGEWGVLIAKGPQICRGYRASDATILDVAPTILAALDMPVGEDMEGTVLKDIFQNEYLSRCPIRYIPSYDGEEDLGEGVNEAFTDEELQALQDKLRRLGYVE